MGDLPMEHRSAKRVGKVAVVIVVGFLVAGNAHADRWVLVDFGTNDGNSSTPHGDWSQIIRHPTNVQYVDPDGNPDHQGVTEVAGLAVGDPSYVGIQGTTPISFQRGHKIILTFYNRSGDEQFFHARISLTDPDSPDPADLANPWYTLYGDIGYGMPGHTTIEMEHYISNADMVNHANCPPSVGNALRVNVNKREPNSNIVLTRIEFSDEADIVPPTPPANLGASPHSTTAGSGQNLVRLTWDASTDPGPHATGVDRYLVYRDGTLYDILPNDMMVHFGPGNLHYIDLNVAPGATYRYTVTAVDAAPFGMYPTSSHPDRRHGNESAQATTVALTTPSWQSSTLIDPWGQLEYNGGIRLPQDLEEHLSYASSGLAYYPDGNPGHDPATEWPGSLYLLTTMCQRVCEISIPTPVASANINDLPRAGTLTAPVDLWPRVYGGNWFPDQGGAPAGGLTYHPGGNGVGGYLYYGICDFYGTDETAAAHGVFNLALTQGLGAWHVGGVPPTNVSPALTARILFVISQTWAELYCGGRSLIVGNTYTSGLGVPSHGPSLYAIAPWEGASLPSNGGSCTAVELLRYSSGAAPENRVINWTMDGWGDGGAWLEIGGRSALAISCVRSVGDTWYGDSLGTFHSQDDIPEPPFGSRGVGATNMKNGLMLYNPADLAAVAAGTLQSWDPQPYCIFDFDRFSMKEQGDNAMAGAIAFDAQNNRLFYIEHNGDPGYPDGYSMLHVWTLRDLEAPTGVPPSAWISY
ncbi:hypothetical protein AMJ85_04335 [candidate division BRC1 bacterium SM23_51]|nr:MAG: hypothetical protein AMJ85_04335 [candidate division BRC1 bacterium SM23_51]